MTQNVFTEQLTGSTLTLTSANGQSVALTASNTGSLLSGGSEVGTGGGSGVTVYANSSVLPLENLTAGDMAFANNNNTLYLTNGFGWYKIALINQTPSVTANLTTVSLGGDGNTALIGYTVSEPEGTPVTVSVANSGLANTSQGNVVLYTSNNTIEINNFAAEGSEWSANVILTVSDGVNIGTSSVTVEVVYSDPPEVSSPFVTTGPGTYVDLDTNTTQHVYYNGTGTSSTSLGATSATTNVNSNGRYAVYGYSHQSFSINGLIHGTHSVGSNNFRSRLWLASPGSNPYGGGTPTNPSGLRTPTSVSYGVNTYSLWALTAISVPADRYFYFEYEDGPYFKKHISPTDNYTFRQNGNPVVTLLRSGWISAHINQDSVQDGGNITSVEGGTDSDTTNWTFSTTIADVGFRITDIGA